MMSGVKSKKILQKSKKSFAIKKKYILFYWHILSSKNKPKEV